MHYVYKFLDKDQKDIYIGMTGDIKKRINQQHFKSSGHLDVECYDETIYVVYSKCRSYDDARIKERYLINKNNPKYNKVHNNKSEFNFIIDDFEWIYIAFDREKFLKNIEKAKENKKNTIIYPYDWNDIQMLVCKNSKINYTSELEKIIAEIMNFSPNKQELQIIIDRLNDINCLDDLINLLHKLSEDKKIEYNPLITLELDKNFYDKYDKNFDIENLYKTYYSIFDMNKDKIIKVKPINEYAWSIMFDSIEVFSLLERTKGYTPNFVAGIILNYNNKTSIVNIYRHEKAETEVDSICKLLQTANLKLMN